MKNTYYSIDISILGYSQYAFERPHTVYIK